MKYLLYFSITILFVLFTANLFFTGCYTQLSPEKNYQQSSVYTQTIKDTTYDDLELNIRFYLYEKYHPGSCFGMPSPPIESMVISTLKENPQLVEIIRDRYSVYTDYDVYRILMSVKTFLLEKTDDGYKFSFVDGDCCEIIDYVGMLYMHNDKIIKSEIISEKSRKVPC